MTQHDSGPDFPGRRLGLPAEGSGAVAGWGRRFLALFVDWIMSLLVVSAFVGAEVWSGRGTAQWAPLAVFALQRWVLTATLAASAGQLLCGVRIHLVDTPRFFAWRVLVRTLLVCLVVPPLIYNRDRRGLHDLAAGTLAVRR